MTEDSRSFLKGLSDEIGGAAEMGAGMAANALEDAALRMLQDLAKQKEAAPEDQRGAFAKSESALQMLLSASRVAPALAGRFASTASFVGLSAGVAAVREGRAALEHLRQSAARRPERAE
jgi:type IV secretory pathway TrbL component